jgi:Ca2+-binding EF-hand superfamily protein
VTEDTNCKEMILLVLKYSFFFLSVLGFDNLFPVLLKGNSMKCLFVQLLFVFFIQISASNLCCAQTNDLKNAFQAADTNQDGKITLDEFKQHAKQESFKNIDRDGDKKIDKQEWKAAVPSPQAEGNFESVDKNRDHAVSFLEFSEKVDKNYNYDEVFNALDRNRDGSLAPDEFNARPAFTIFSIKF